MGSTGETLPTPSAADVDGDDDAALTAGCTEPDLSWRERKKRITRQALHDAAREMVLDSGLAAVTIEAICARAGVAPRTFFHYFPSKGAAALGVIDLSIPEQERDRFLASDSGDLMGDLCALVIEVVAQGDAHLLDRHAKQELVKRRPELMPDLFLWVARLRRQFFDLAEERAPGDRTRAAVMLVMVALTEALGPSGTAEGTFAERLWATAAALCAVGAESAPLLCARALPGGRARDSAGASAAAQDSSRVLTAAGAPLLTADSGRS